MEGDGSSALARMEAGRSTPVAAGRFAVQFMFRAQANEKLAYACSLGFRAEEAPTVAARCGSIPEAPLEQRLKVALAWYGRCRLVGILREPAQKRSTCPA